jgi:hypothetical protein
MEDTYLEHPPEPVCTLGGSVDVAEVAGNYLCAEHAIETTQRGAGQPVEETTNQRM